MKRKHLSLGLILPGLLSILLLGAAYAQVDIPLYVYNTSTNAGSAAYKLGIPVELGGSGSSYMYEFDTGGYGFYAGSGGSDDWTNGATGTTNNGFIMSYPSGNQYTADEVITTVALMSGMGSNAAVAETVTNVGIGKIISGSNPDSNDPVNNFNGNIAAGRAPLDNYFYGDFGMRLGSNNSLAAPIPQLTDAALNNGYVINAGTYPGSSNTTGLLSNTVATLQIGLSANDTNPSNWSQVIWLEHSGTYPNSGQSNYLGYINGGTFSIHGGTNGGTVSGSSQIVFDTGNPNSALTTTDTNVLNQLLPFVSLTYSNGGTNIYSALPGETVTLTGSTNGTNYTALTLDSTGTNSGSNVFSVISHVPSEGEIVGSLFNTGIDAFWGRKVVFDLQDGFIGLGYIGPVPEPSTDALLVLGGIALLIVARRSGLGKR